MEILIIKVKEMKKVILGVSLLLAGMISAQSYPDYYPYGGQSDYYSDYDDEFYFPEDYYYEYPENYYTPELYSNYYDAYRHSISQVNWNRFFRQYRLSPWQVQQIMLLNESFPSFSAWSSYYRYNPDRWYYDRFYALQQILGPRIFVVFQNNYYNGYNPVTYYHDYNRRHYVRTVYVMPRYRHININHYKVNPKQYHASNPRTQIGFKDSPRVGTSSGSGTRGSSGFRNDPGTANRISDMQRNDTRRSSAQSPSVQRAPQTRMPSARENSSRSDNGFRNNATGRQRSPEATIRNNGSSRSGNTSARNPGMRLTSR